MNDRGLFLPSSFCLHPSYFVLPTALPTTSADPSLALAEQARRSSRQFPPPTAAAENRAHPTAPNRPTPPPRPDIAAPGRRPTAHPPHSSSAAPTSPPNRSPTPPPPADKTDLL